MPRLIVTAKPRMAPTLATSSSIFIAAPILLNIGEHYLRRGGPVAEATPQPAQGKFKGA